jgi:hypothetical protein
MSDFLQLFSEEELLRELQLLDLDPKELALLKAAIRHEIRHSAQIRETLRARVRRVYAQLRPSPAPEPPGKP